VDYSSGVPLVDCQSEWASLGEQELFKCVYVETALLWAKRVLLNEDNRAVAWPARVSSSHGIDTWYQYLVLVPGTNTWYCYLVLIPGTVTWY